MNIETRLVTIAVLLLAAWYFCVPPAAVHEGRDADEWIAQLSSTRPPERASAIDAVAAMAKAEANDLNALQRLYLSTGRMIGLLPNSTQTMAGLVSALGSKDPRVRKTAVATLVEVGDAAGPALSDAIAQGDPNVLWGIRLVLKSSPNALERQDVAALDTRLGQSEPVPAYRAALPEYVKDQGPDFPADEPVDMTKMTPEEREARRREIEEDPSLTGDEKMRKLYDESRGTVKLTKPGR